MNKSKIRCWFKHDWKDWVFYDQIDDAVRGTYSGKSKVLRYLPVFHFRVCNRCGHREEHDFRIHPLTPIKFMTGEIGAVGISEDEWTEWQQPRSHYEKDGILSPQTISPYQPPEMGES